MGQAHTHLLLSLSISCQITTTLRCSQSASRAGGQSVGWARRGNSWPPLSTHLGYLAWHQLLVTDISLPNAACGKTDGQAVPREWGEGRDRARKPLHQQVCHTKPLACVSLKASQSSLWQSSGAGGLKVKRFNGTNKARGDRWHHAVDQLVTQSPKKEWKRGRNFPLTLFQSQFNFQAVREPKVKLIFKAVTAYMCVCVWLWASYMRVTVRVHTSEGDWLKREGVIKPTSTWFQAALSDFLIISQCQCHYKVEKQWSVGWMKVKAINSWLQGAGGNSWSSRHRAHREAARILPTGTSHMMWDSSTWTRGSESRCQTFLNLLCIKPLYDAIYYPF